jgi:hypothetical protein
MMAKRPETYSIYVGVSPTAGVVVNYDRIDPDHPMQWLMISSWLVPGTFINA